MQTNIAIIKLGEKVCKLSGRPERLIATIKQIASRTDFVAPCIEDMSLPEGSKYRGALNFVWIKKTPTGYTSCLTRIGASGRILRNIED